MYSDLVCSGIYPTHLLLESPMRTQIRLILQYDFSDPHVSRDVYYYHKATLIGHMRQCIIKRMRK